MSTIDSYKEVGISASLMGCDEGNTNESCMENQPVAFNCTFMIMSQVIIESLQDW